MAALFPNEDALLRLATAALGEIDEDWATSKIYLSMKHRNPRHAVEMIGTRNYRKEVALPSAASGWIAAPQHGKSLHRSLGGPLCEITTFGNRESRTPDRSLTLVTALKYFAMI